MPMNSPPRSLPDSPFHEGELAIHERLGIREKIEAQGRRGIRDFMPDQHRSFFAQLPFLLIGTVDRRGQPWASIVVGRPGFVTSPDPRGLHVSARALPGDPLGETLREGIDIGLLGIEPPTRRRNRLNGRIADAAPDGFAVEVGQSFGNCPQYIQARTPQFITDPDQVPAAVAVERRTRLSEADLALIAAADTFFVASANEAAVGAARGVDVSHRGGKPGFVRLDDVTTLTTPDFTGNYLFNTLGNLSVEPRAGLLFIDFRDGDLLYLAADAEIIWDGPEVAAFTGAQRLVRFHLRQVIRTAGALPLRWSGPDFSPQLARTGSWGEVG